MGGRKRGRETINVWLPFTLPPTGDLACNPGMCPRLEIEQTTLWFTGQHSIHQATPARENNKFLLFKPLSLMQTLYC